jgi:hypothetical protein
MPQGGDEFERVADQSFGGACPVARGVKPNRHRCHPAAIRLQAVELLQRQLDDRVCGWHVTYRYLASDVGFVNERGLTSSRGWSQWRDRAGFAPASLIVPLSARSLVDGAAASQPRRGQPPRLCQRSTPTSGQTPRPWLRASSRRIGARRGGVRWHEAL